MKVDKKMSEVVAKPGRDGVPSPSAAGAGRKGMRCFMLAIVFLATILGCASIMDRLDWLPKIPGLTRDDGMTNIVAKAAEPAKANEILTSVANAAEIFSIRMGGGGDSLFPTNAFQMRDNMPPVVAKSIEGCFSDSVVPLGGYVCRYEVDPARTDFMCRAIPADGYTGAVFVVHKDMKIVHVSDVTCISPSSASRKRSAKLKRRHGMTNIVAKAAEPAKANELLTSVANAAEIFSIRVGGGGDSLFPTDAFQMRDNMPSVVAKSIEGCFSAPVVPLGGYVCQYEVDSARTNFMCRAIPANGYTGAVFVVHKDMKIVHVGDVTCSLTNSVHQK